MGGLVLELKQDELIIINGASIRFRSKARIEINGKARFLFGKQILLPAEAETPAARIYIAIQTAYIGDGEERAQALVRARAAVEAFKAGTSSALARDILDRIIALTEADDCYEALKLARRIMRHEATMNGGPADGGPVRDEPRLRGADGCGADR
jgi:flagellar protein FlbT